MDDPIRRCSVFTDWAHGDWSVTFDHPEDDAYPKWMVDDLEVYLERFHSAKRNLIRVHERMLSWRCDEEDEDA